MMILFYWKINKCYYSKVEFMVNSVIFNSKLRMILLNLCFTSYFCNLVIDYLRNVIINNKIIYIKKAMATE